MTFLAAILDTVVQYLREVSVLLGEAIAVHAARPNETQETVPVFTHAVV